MSEEPEQQQPETALPPVPGGRIRDSEHSKAMRARRLVLAKAPDPKVHGLRGPRRLDRLAAVTLRQVQRLEAAGEKVPPATANAATKASEAHGELAVKLESGRLVHEDVEQAKRLLLQARRQVRRA